MPIDASVRNVTPTLTFSRQSRLPVPPTVQCGSHTLFYFMWCGGGITTICSWCSAELLSWPSIWIPITLAANARKIAFYKDKFLHWSLINAKVKVWGPKRNEIKSDQLFFQHYPKVLDMIFLWSNDHFLRLLCLCQSVQQKQSTLKVKYEIWYLGPSYD